MSRRLIKRRVRLNEAILSELERFIAVRSSFGFDSVHAWSYGTPNGGNYLVLFSSPDPEGGALAPIDEAVAVAADLVANGYKIVDSLIRTPSRNRDQARLLKAITPDLGRDLSAYFAHALVRADQLETDQPELEAGYQAAAKLLGRYFPLDAEVRSTIDEAEEAYRHARAKHENALEVFREKQHQASEPRDTSSSDFETHCTQGAVQMIPAGGEIIMSGRAAEMGAADRLVLWFKWAPFWTMAIWGQRAIVGEFLVRKA